MTTNQMKRNYHNQKGRASAFISKGSLSIEAALAAPFFLIAMLCILYIFEMIHMETSMRTILFSAAKKMAKEAYVSTAFPATRLKYHVLDDMETSSIIKKGSIDCSDSYCHRDSSLMELSLKYKIEIPVFVFRIPIATKEETLRVKGWTGYENVGFAIGEEDIVYITATGLVYHSTPTCNYLDLSIRRVTLKEAKDRCPACTMCKGNGKKEFVYITTYGESYHNSLNCSGLKRSIFAVKKSEVKGRGGCDKCVR